jgi:DNA (cytosine-5)-methyltransferase 1
VSALGASIRLLRITALSFLPRSGAAEKGAAVAVRENPGLKAVPSPAGRVVELFAGVGGFRLGLERSGWEVIWANQWEPGTKAQHAFDCYTSQFDSGIHVNEDINVVLDEVEAGSRDDIPDHDLLVGGFPCQDYSVAKTLGQAHGIEGRKGVLWWSIHRILERKRPRLVLLENVDRLLKSPAAQRGRDFAIILACLSELGYLVEWRVANAADYGFPQRRRRVFIVGHLIDGEPRWNGPDAMLFADGVLARALPVISDESPLTSMEGTDVPNVLLTGDPAQITQDFGLGRARSPFLRGGVMWDRAVWTRDVVAPRTGPRETLGDILQPDELVPPNFLIPTSSLEQWRYLKGAKRENRTAENGHQYVYSEGAIPFPDPLDRPSRTILTGEGGATPSRFKHVVQMADGQYRRLTPVELERLNGFPPGWTATGMSDGRRAFMMGNALVVGLIERIGRAALARSPQTVREVASAASM